MFYMSVASLCVQMVIAVFSQNNSVPDKMNTPP